MRITKDSLKWPQIDFAMKFVWDNPDKYDWKEHRSILEFGTGSGSSLWKIINYLYDNYWVDCVDVFGFDSWNNGLPAEDPSIECFSKYTEGSYKYKKPKVPYANLIEKPFDQLCREDAEGICKAIFIHVDCDLYLSTKQALGWVFDNHLAGVDTLIAFDEFQSTSNLISGGESLAWYEIAAKYGIKYTSIFNSVYTDKDTGVEITQCVVRVDNV